MKDDAWPHTTEKILRVLKTFHEEILRPTSYNSDLTPTVFHTFTNLKVSEELKEKAAIFLNGGNIRLVFKACHKI